MAQNLHKANLWIFLENCSNEICSNEIRIRRELPVFAKRDLQVFLKGEVWVR